MKKIIFSVLIACLSTTAMGGDFIMIVNKGSSLASASPADLKRLYTGKVSDIGGTKVAPANLGLDNPAAASFLKEIVGMADADYKSFWLAQQIRGGSSAPAVRKTADAMLEFVSTTDNAIGYVPTGTPTDNVKVLTVKYASARSGCSGGHCTSRNNRFFLNTLQYQHFSATFSASNKTAPVRCRCRSRRTVLAVRQSRSRWCHR